MSITAIVGANWGDEGKGKMVDVLSENADAVVRFQGGSNAGHTVINQFGKFSLHMLPSGVFRSNVLNILGPGVALDVEAFLTERQALLNAGVPEPKLVVSDRAQLVMPYHIAFDVHEEERLGTECFGSTHKGIAPFYADKYLKLGVQVGDLYDETVLAERIKRSLVAKNVLGTELYGLQAFEVSDLVNKAIEWRQKLHPFIQDTTPLLRELRTAHKHILLEGQLGALRDPDHGVYPYPTSSSPLTGFASVGAGVPPWAIEEVICVTKAYSSCVGECPFVTELLGEDGHELRERGGSDGEYGATTGRPRRVGWFDVVATRHGCQVQGATSVALTLLDVLGYRDTIPVCTAYEIDGQETTNFPAFSRLRRAKPIYKTLAGWKTDISGVRAYEELPVEARRYIEYIETAVQVPVEYVSVGPERDALIVKPS